MWPAGQYLPDAVLDMAWLCAVHDWRKGCREEKRVEKPEREKKRHDVLAFKIYNWLTWKQGFNVRTLF